MISINSHIENLLLCYDCVIVPGLGGFLTRYEDSTFIHHSGEITPPYRSVSFNSQLKTNDGLLIHSYMTTYDTNYPKAQQLLDDDIRALKDILHKGEPCEIGSIGTLQQTQNGALIFTPNAEQLIPTKDFYGLTDSNISLARQNAVKAKAPKVTTTKIVATTKKHTNASPTPGNKTATKRKMEKVNTNISGNNKKATTDTHYVIRLNKNAVRYTVATIAAAMLYFVFSIAPTVSTNNNNIQEAAIIGTSKTATTAETTPAVATPATQETTPATKDPIPAPPVSGEQSVEVGDNRNHQSRQTTLPLQGEQGGSLQQTPAETPPSTIITTPKISIDNTPETIYFG